MSRKCVVCMERPMAIDGFCLKCDKAWFDAGMDGSTVIEETRVAWAARRARMFERRRASVAIEKAVKVIAYGLKYHEYDGHCMPKRVAREALAVLMERNAK